jgi:GNAT superfamily N-acetyltransferase
MALPAGWAVRPALQADLASVVTSINEAFAHKTGDVDYSMGSDGRTSADDIQGCHDAEGCVVFCCCDSVDRVVGAVVFNSDGVATTEPATINMLAVRPSYERRGVASALVGACEDQAAREGRPSVRAEIISVQEHLQGVYESWGFAKVGFEQPEHMRQWVRPEFFPAIGFIIYEKRVGVCARL